MKFTDKQDVVYVSSLLIDLQFDAHVLILEIRSHRLRNPYSRNFECFLESLFACVRTEITMRGPN